MDTQKPQIAKAVLRKKNGAGGINLPEFRLQTSLLLCILQSYSHQDSMVLAEKQKYRPMEQERKPRKNPCTYGYLIFDKGSKNIQWGKNSLSINGAGKIGQLRVEMKLEYFLTPYTKINSKWVKDLNVGPETIKLLKKT